MVATCHDAGVQIYVDAVVNHMAGGGSTGPGSGGSSYSHFGYPAVPYGDGDFHHCGRNGNDDIANCGDRFEVQNCELVDLSDLKHPDDANMVALAANVAAGAPATNWLTNGSDQIGFGRGAAAYTAFNRGGTVLDRTFQTGLPAGTSCDVMNGDLAGRTCSGPSHTVGASGQVGANVTANGALALHIGARLGA